LGRLKIYPPMLTARVRGIISGKKWKLGANLAENSHKLLADRKRKSKNCLSPSTCTSAASPVQPLRFKREPDYINNKKNKVAGVFFLA